MVTPLSSMVTPLGNWTPDEPGPSAFVRYGAVWDTAHASVTDARRAVRTLLARAGHRPDQRPNQDAQLVVSELVSNAIQHAPGPGGLLLEVTPDATLLRITVRDSSRRLPRPQARDALRIGGHGLHLVGRLCDKLRTVTLDTGKLVTAHLRLYGATG
ncbi:ATP-binding protein [Streptomyces sp. NPDC051452]|uniref:ATP-binding protein n=1 Tax=Streptomyces sp. NPDC051452 TaxID=3365654 RepID=UPI0037988A41